MKDFGFIAFKEQLGLFDRGLNSLKEGRLNIENPGAVFCGLKRQGDDFEAIRVYASRFKRALRVVSGLEFKIDWSMTDNFLNVKFDADGHDDIHDKIRQVFRGDERRVSARDASADDGERRERRKSFLDHPVNSMTPVLAKRETQYMAPARSQLTLKTPTSTMRESLFSNIEPVEDKRNSCLTSRNNLGDSRWGESDMGLDEFDIPSLKGSMHAPSKTTSTPDQSENFVRKMTAQDVYAPATRAGMPIKATPEGLAVKPSATKPYVSQRRVQVESFHPPAVESQRALMVPQGGGCEIGTVSNQAIDETKFKLIIAELRASQKMFERIEFVNNTFKCNPYKLLKGVLTERMGCEVKIDESKNKWQVRTKLSKKEIQGFKELNVTVLQS